MRVIVFGLPIALFLSCSLETDSQRAKGGALNGNTGINGALPTNNSSGSSPQSCTNAASQNNASPAQDRYSLLTQSKISPALATAKSGDFVAQFIGADNDRVVVVVKKPIGTTAITISPNQGETGESYFSRAIASAKAAGATILNLAPGTYSFANYALVDKVSDLVVDGHGAVLSFVNNPYNSQAGLRIMNSERLHFRNLTIEWNFAAIGSRLASTAVVLPPACPSCNATLQLDNPTSTSTQAGAVTEFSDGNWLSDRAHGEAYFGGNQRLNINPSGCSVESAALNHLVGRKVLARHFVYENTAITGDFNNDITLDTITLRDIPSMGISLSGGRGLHILNCVITKKGNSPVSQGADGIHPTVTSDLVIENNDIGYQGDDAINAPGHLLGAKSQNGTRIQLDGDSWKLYFLKPKFIVMFFDKGYNYLGSGVVESVDMNSSTINLTSNPPNGVATILNQTLTPQRFIIRNNHLHHNRARGILINGANGLVQNNNIHDTTLSAMHVEASPNFWKEGPGANNVSILNNNITNVSANEHSTLGAIAILADDDGPYTTNLLNTYIKLAGNQFSYIRNSSARAIYADHTASNISQLDNYYGVQRTFNSSTGHHEIIASGFMGKGTWEGVVFGAYLSNWTAGLTPLYNCVTADSDYILSGDSKCEGNTLLSPVGYVWAQPNANSGSAIYRCFTGTEHFFSIDKDCENTKVEGILGYQALRPKSNSPCAATNVTWGTGCSGTSAILNHGASAQVSNANCGTSGSATVSCSNGVATVTDFSCSNSTSVPGEGNR